MPKCHISSVQSLSHARLCATTWITACQASLSITSSWSLPKLMCIKSVMRSSHLILCRPLLLLPLIPPSIRVFSSKSAVSSVQFSSVAQSCPTLCDHMNHSLPGLPVHHQLPESTQIHVPSNHLILHCPLLLLPSTPPSIRAFSNESALRIRWPKYWSFSFNIIPSNEYPGLISFRIDWWISLQSNGLSGVFSNTTVQKHQFFGTQLSLLSNSHIHKWLLEKP